MPMPVRSTSAGSTPTHVPQDSLADVGGDVQEAFAQGECTMNIAIHTHAVCVCVRERDDGSCSLPQCPTMVSWFPIVVMYILLLRKVTVIEYHKLVWLLLCVCFVCLQTHCTCPGLK